MESLVTNSSFWSGRRVFLTGHTGFKGSWLSLWLGKLGAHVVGYALKPPSEPSLFKDANVFQVMERSVFGDICNASELCKTIQQAAPEIVIHMAAQSLVHDSYINPVQTYNTNVMGTVNLLEAVRNTPTVKAVLNITSDKCYENRERSSGYSENEAMGGHDPYSSSKGCAELVSSAYRNSFLQKEGIALATARAGNIIGGGDWAKYRIVPDAIRAFTGKKKLLVRNPHAIRPWQNVLEPLSGYLLLCEYLIKKPEDFATGWNFGPDDENVKSVSKLADIMVSSWGDNVEWTLDEEPYPHEAEILKLDCTKAKTKLNWNPIWSLERALKETVLWYKAWNNASNMNDFTLRQIETYEKEHLVK